MRGRVAVIAVGAAVVAFFVARYLGWILPQPGPLHAPGSMFRTNARGSSTVTATFRLDESDAGGPIELHAAEAIDVDEGLDTSAAQVLLCRGTSFCAPSYATPQWPPRRAVPEPVEGYVVDGNRGTRTIIGVPVTLPEGPGRYGLRGLRVEYTQGNRRYRAEVGPNVVFVVRE